MKHFVFLALALTCYWTAAASAETGMDLRRVFTQARQGDSLCCVFLGGSITQSGEGWIGGWLREQFPKSRVSIVNSGMSATGSGLGVFRLERDVIAYQPDLVAIEYCVNDGDQTDEETIRYMESIIVRLKKRPNPPAIIILEAAAKRGVNLARHRRVAQHYELAEVDLQKAVDARLKESGEPWETYFSDAVHPNASGNKFYSQSIAKALAPYAEGSSTKLRQKPAVALPAPLSAQPLLLDGRMVSLSNFTAEWKRENSLPFWWNRFFQGVLSADKPGTRLTIPVHGTFIGLFYAMEKSYGTFFASVDEALPQHIAANSRGGYSYSLIGKDLAPGEHRLSVTLPAEASSGPLNGPVKLGYILLAGTGNKTKIPQGPFPADLIARLRMTPLPNTQWKWSGPYGSPSSGDTQPSSIHKWMDQEFSPEATLDLVEWKPVDTGEDTDLDFRKLTGRVTQDVVYTETSIASQSQRNVILAISCDYYAKIWLNGKLIASFLDFHGSPSNKILISARLQEGDNRLLVKLGAGTEGFKLSVGIFDDQVPPIGGKK
ncbi:MAG: SGNH/GDSL hydrolase family protein [Chthoniobacteraceae bacterium]